MRWAAIAALGVPLFLAVTFLVARLTGNNALASQAIRSVRYLLAAEFVAALLLAATGMLYEGSAKKRDQQSYHVPGKLVDIGGYRLHLDCAGKGPTVVLEYGHQGAYTDWFRVQPQIAGFARVCVYDRGGYGWSDTSPKPRIPSVMADELHTLLHTAGENPPYTLVGHSFGGLNALTFAHKFPSEVAGLVLVDASLPEMMAPFRWQDRTRLRMMQAILPFGLPRWREWCGGAAPEEIRGLKQAISCRSSLYGTFYRESSSFPQTAAEIQAITGIGSIPLIVITRDPSVEGNSIREVKWNRLQLERMKLSSNSEFMVASGSGHDVPIDRPDAIAAAVKKLIQTRAISSQSQHPPH